LGNAQKRVENSNRKKKIVENVEELSPNLGQMLKRRFCVPIGKKKQIKVGEFFLCLCSFYLSFFLGFYASVCVNVLLAIVAIIVVVVAGA